MRNNFFVAILSLFIISCARQEPDTLQTFELNSITLLESPFRRAQEASLRYILEMDVDRLLAPYIREAGLTPLAESYGNWENTGLDGHIGGHYLSALSIMYAATGTPGTTTATGIHGSNGLQGVRRHTVTVMWEEYPAVKHCGLDIARGKIEPANFSLNDRWVPMVQYS
jgi:uncharacterized protein